MSSVQEIRFLTQEHVAAAMMDHPERGFDNWRLRSDFNAFTFELTRSERLDWINVTLPLRGQESGGIEFVAAHRSEGQPEEQRAKFLMKDNIVMPIRVVDGALSEVPGETVDTLRLFLRAVVLTLASDEQAPNALNFIYSL